MKVGEKLVRDMTPDELQLAREQFMRELNQSMSIVLKAIEAYTKASVMVNVIAFEQERRKNTLQIASSLNGLVRQ